MDDLREWCYGNWMLIPEDTRNKCVDHLDGWISKEIIEQWIKTPYDDDPYFHFGEGMQIRNRLRDILKDSELPALVTEHGVSQNWDDYYTGALDQLIERYKK